MLLLGEERKIYRTRSIQYLWADLISASAAPGGETCHRADDLENERRWHVKDPAPFRYLKPPKDRAFKMVFGVDMSAIDVRTTGFLIANDGPF